MIKLPNRGQITKIKITERGWAGHFCGALQCRFRRNTLIEFGDQRVVVSTVELYEPFAEHELNIADKATWSDGPKFVHLRADCYFETAAFWADPEDTRYRDADVTKEITIDSKWKISEIDADDKANIMHDRIVQELSIKLQKGKLIYEI